MADRLSNLFNNGEKPEINNRTRRTRSSGRIDLLKIGRELAERLV